MVQEGGAELEREVEALGQRADGDERRRPGPGQAAILDTWDGYQAERSEILEHFEAKGVENLSS